MCEKKAEIVLELSYYELMDFCIIIADQKYEINDSDRALFKIFFSNALDLMENWEQAEDYLNCRFKDQDINRRFLEKALEIVTEFWQAMKIFEVVFGELGEKALQRAMQLATTFQEWQDIFYYCDERDTEYRALEKMIELSTDFEQVMTVSSKTDSESSLESRCWRRAIELAVTEDQLLQVNKLIDPESDSKELLDKKLAELRAKSAQN